MLRTLIALTFATPAAAQTCWLDSDIVPGGELTCNSAYQFVSDCFSDASRYGSCSSLTYNGAEDSFPFRPPSGKHAWVRMDSLDNGLVDLDLFVTRNDNCGSGLTCTGSSTGVGATEVVGPFDSVGGTYYVTVDDFEGDWCNFEYLLTVGCSGTCAAADVARPLTCSSDIADSTASGSRKLDAYTCGSPNTHLVQTNPERIYTFVAQATGTVTFRLSNMSVDQDIYVLADSCDPRSCIGSSTRAATNTDEVTFNAVSGRTYYIVVEGYAGVGSYNLSFTDNSGGCKEDCDDGLDNDADGRIDCNDSDCAADASCNCDADGDGVRATSATCGGVDCNDVDATVYPSAPELCDGKDNNCNGQTDENAGDTWYRDADSDTFGAPGGSLRACSQPAGYVTNNTDCDDTDAAIRPGASERCNNVDDNCNGQIDESVSSSDWFRDGDNDGYGAGSATRDCKAPGEGWVNQGGDCHDSDPTIRPGASERCNEVDDNCNGQVDEDVVTAAWYVDADGDGWGTGTARVDCAQPAGYVEQKGDCNDSNANISPDATEACNSVDDNCDGLIDPGCEAPDTNGGDSDSGPEDTNDDDSGADDSDDPIDPGEDSGSGYGSLKGCSCSSPATQGGPPAVLLLLGVLLRRRR